MSFRSFLGKKEEKEKKPVSTGGFKDFLKQAPTKTVEKQVSKSPFNPNTPGHAEYMRQINTKERSPSTSLAKNFLSTLGDYGKIAAELPKSLATPFRAPSEGAKQIEDSLSTSGPGKILKPLAKPFVRGFIAPITEGLGTQVGTAIGSKGKELPSSGDAFMAGANFGFGTASTIAGGLPSTGKALSTKKSTLTVTPEQIRNVLSRENLPAVARGPLEQLAKKGQGFTMNLERPAGGVKQAVGEFLGGSPSKTTKITPTEGKAQLEAPSKAITPNVVERLNRENNVPELTYKPIEQKPIVTPEIKTSKLAQGVEDKVIQKKLADGFGDLPEYAKVNVKDQATAASSLLKTDKDKAVRIAMGQELPPEGLLPESLFVAVENYALKTKDVGLLRDLATASSLSSEATGMGQRIRMLAERSPNSAVSAIRKVQKIREEAVKDIKKAKEKVKSEIKDEVRKSAPKAKDWASFIESIKCT